MKKNTIILFSLVALVAFGSSAYGGSKTDTLNVSANVVPSCWSRTLPVDFGDSDLTETSYSNGVIYVTCQSGVIYKICLDGGLNPADSPTGLTRHLSRGTEISLPYYLYKDASHIDQWGNSDCGTATFPTGSSLGATATGGEISHVVRGILSSWGPSVSVGLHSDTVIATVEY